MAHIDLAACPDCSASVSATVGRSGISGGPVLVVEVEHDATCPWFARFVPAGESVNAPTPDRVIRHVRAVG